jgi:hypothetical protein
VIGKAIFGRLTTEDNVAAIVATRVFPQVDVDESAAPRIEYEVTGDDPVYPIEVSNLSRGEVSIELVAETEAAVADLAIAVVNALNDQAGTWGGVVVQGCFCQTSGSDTMPLLDGDRIFYTRGLSATIWYQPN